MNRGKGKHKLNAIFYTGVIYGAKFYPLCKTQLKPKKRRKRSSTWGWAKLFGFGDHAM